MNKQKSGPEALPSRSVAFRLGGEYLAILEAQALQQNSSVGMLAQEYVMTAIREKETKDSLLEILSAITNEMRQMRIDIALFAETSLAWSGKLNSDQAKEWVVKELRRDQSEKTS